MSHEELETKPNASAINEEYSTMEAVAQTGVNAQRLRYWENYNIVSPKYVRRGSRSFRRYTGLCIARAVLVRLLLEKDHYTLERAVLKLNDLA